MMNVEKQSKPVSTLKTIIFVEDFLLFPFVSGTGSFKS